MPLLNLTWNHTGPSPSLWLHMASTVKTSLNHNPSFCVADDGLLCNNWCKTYFFLLSPIAYGLHCNWTFNPSGLLSLMVPTVSRSSYWNKIKKPSTHSLSASLTMFFVVSVIKAQDRRSYQSRRHATKKAVFKDLHDPIYETEFVSTKILKY